MPGKQQALSLHLKGLYTNPSQFGEVPGANDQAVAMSVANDVVLDRESFFRTRRGYARYGNSFGAVDVRNEFTFGNTLIAHTSDGRLWLDSDGYGTFTAYSGTYLDPDTSAGTRIRSLEANKNFYFTTSNGLYKLDAFYGEPQYAGAPEAFMGQGIVNGTTGFMNSNANVAYRIIWGYEDANGNLVLGPPCSSFVVSNPAISLTVTAVAGEVLTVGSTTGLGLAVGQFLTQTIAGTTTTEPITAVGATTVTMGAGTWSTGAATVARTANVSLTFQIPTQVTVDWFVQVYRSAQTASTLYEPTDDLQLCYEGNPTTGEIASRTFTFVDDTPDSLLGSYIYTAPDFGTGIDSANYQAPWAKDIALYGSYTFLANTYTIHRFELTLDTPPTVGTTLTFTDEAPGAATFTLTAGTTETAPTGTYQTFSTGNPALDIQNTAQSLLRVLNAYPSNTFLNGFYDSGFTTLPGECRIEKRQLSEYAFYVTSPAGSDWQPVLPETGDTVYSTNDVAPNRIYYSNELQPEAYPLLNFINVGSANQPIDRIIALRNALIIMKQDGIWRLYGTSPSNFQLLKIETNCRLLAPRSAVVLDDQIYAWTNEGIVTISESNVAIISRAIETDLNQYTSPDLLPSFSDLCFGVSNTGDRHYIIALPSNQSDVCATQEYVWNYVTQQWTRWTRTMSCGLCNETGDRKNYFGGPNLTGFGGYVFQERKSLTNNDYADESYTVTVESVDSTGYVLTLNSVANVQVGYTIGQSYVGGIQANITAISGNTVTVDSIQPWQTVYGDAYSEGYPYNYGDDIDITAEDGDIIETDNGYALQAEIGATPPPTTAPPSSAVATVYVPILASITTLALDAGNPGVMKKYFDASFVFSQATFDEVTATFLSDISQAPGIVNLIPVQQGQWGLFQWGNLQWGGGFGGAQRIRCLVPQEQRRSNWMYVNLSSQQAFTSLDVSGMSFMFTVQGEKQR